MGMTPLAAPSERQPNSCIGVDEALQVVDGQNAALFLDVDGTLLDLASKPDAVLVPDGLVGILGRAGRKLKGALAIVSGRTIEDIDRLFTPLHLRASGVHGAQFACIQWIPSKLHPQPANCLCPSGSP